MSTPRCVTVTAPSRLHFGLFAFDAREGPSYGGAGLMIEEPHIRVRIEAAEQFAVAGPAADRVAGVARRLVESGLLAAMPPCRVEVVAAPPQHSGLGVGTQLALSVATAVLRHLGVAPPDVASLAALVGRGRRSAIGTHGFAQGGMLVDAGKQSDDEVAPLAARVELPAAWRVVLLECERSPSVSGDAEERAFARLPPVSRETSERLRRLAMEEIVPAAAAGEFERFARAVSRFNADSGACFAAVQGGPYASPIAAQWVQRFAKLGEHAGQSSWGPTLFAFVEDEQRAAALKETIGPPALDGGWRPRIVRPASRGAIVAEL